MTLAHLRYGNLEPPEQSNVQTMNQSPADVLASAFAVYSQVVPYRRLFRNDVEPAYREAAKIILPYASAFSGVSAKEFEQMWLSAASLHPQPAYLGYDGQPGIFLSAVLNCTGLEAMAGVFDKFEHLGYRLGRGKLLVIRRGSVVDNAGCYSEGILIDGSRSSETVADGARSGLQISYAKYTLSFSEYSENVVTIEFPEFWKNHLLRAWRRNCLELILSRDGKDDVAFHHSNLFGRASFRETEPFCSLMRRALDSARELAWLYDNPDFDLAKYPPAYWRQKDAELKNILKELNSAVAGYRGK